MSQSQRWQRVTRLPGPCFNPRGARKSGPGQGENQTENQRRRPESTSVPQKKRQQGGRGGQEDFPSPEKGLKAWGRGVMRQVHAPLPHHLTLIEPLIHSTTSYPALTPRQALEMPRERERLPARGKEEGDQNRDMGKCQQRPRRTAKQCSRDGGGVAWEGLLFCGESSGMLALRILSRDSEKGGSRLCRPL